MLASLAFFKFVYALTHNTSILVRPYIYLKGATRVQQQFRSMKTIVETGFLSMSTADYCLVLRCSLFCWPNVGIH